MSEEIGIDKGESNTFASLFTVTTGDGGIATKTYTLNGNLASGTNNTSVLPVGTHTITCTATYNGMSDTATVTVVVEPAPIIATDGSWSGKVNNPLLMEGMTAVYWSTDGGATPSTTQEGATPIYSKVGGKSTGADNPNFVWENWYKYVEGNNSTDTKTSRWANAVTDDGSYWVWVPRYKYLISDQPTTTGNDKAGKIDIKFIQTSERKGADGYTTTANSDGEILTTDSNGYIIHPAFENGGSSGKDNGYANGEWDSELPGFWIAKYEMSMEDANGNNVNTSSSTIGNVKISDTAKMVSKPGVQSWRYIQIGQVFQNCLLYDEDKNSHQMKNSEWGATAYLTHSQYGRNRNEITVNNSSGYYTGNAGDSPTDTSKQETIGHAYNTTTGMLASTTGNIYGVYDMSGGAYEYTAGWDTLSSTSSYGQAKDGTVYFTKNGTSDKYKTAYSNGTSTNSGERVKTVCRTGDGIKEIWISSYISWFNDYATFGYSSSLFFSRGSQWGRSTSGVFASNYSYGDGSSNGYSFRAVLAKGIIEVSPVSEEIGIDKGESNTLASLFTVTTGDGGTATITYTLNGVTASANSNTKDLTIGIHTITCIAEYKGYRESASVTVNVIGNLPTEATVIQAKTNKYQDGLGNSFVVPGGFKVIPEFAQTVDKGIVIEDSTGNNQFVWVPIGEVTRKDLKEVNIELGRYSDFSLTATPAQYATENRWNADVPISTYYSELTTYRESKYASQMENSNATAKDLQGFITNAIENGGYYIARYEASFGSGDKISSVTDGTTSEGTKAITNQVPYFKQSTSANSSYSTNIGTVTSTPGMLWNYIRQGDASLACQNLYAGNEYNGRDFVDCDLVNSYAWDTAIMFIQLCSEKTDYSNQTRLNSTLYNTGTDTGKVTDIACNIYDMAGNLWEWTTEYSSYGAGVSCIIRGGYYTSVSEVADRGNKYAIFWNNTTGFRSVLTVPYAVQVNANQETLEIAEGTENTFVSLFTVTTADGGTATKTYTLNGNPASGTNNTSELAVGTHTITCTATYNGVSDSASMTVVVIPAGPDFSKVYIGGGNEETDYYGCIWNVPNGYTPVILSCFCVDTDSDTTRYAGVSLAEQYESGVTRWYYWLDQIEFGQLYNVHIGFEDASGNLLDIDLYFENVTEFMDWESYPINL